MKATKGYISEVFGSFQGEGPYLGERHIFVRLCGCNLGCGYCDTKHARVVQPVASLSVGPGQGDVKAPNPLTVECVAASVMAQEVRPGFNAKLALTGGEPLMQPAFIKGLLTALDGRFSVLLETNGTLTRAFGTVKEFISVVSMDVKLPSVSGQGEQWRRHAGFIKACGGRELIVKAVVSENTTVSEVARATGMLARIAPDALFVIQPLTGAGGVPKVSAGRLEEFYYEAGKHIGHIRVIPQTHRLMGVR